MKKSRICHASAGWHPVLAALCLMPAYAGMTNQLASWRKHIGPYGNFIFIFIFLIMGLAGCQTARQGPKDSEIPGRYYRVKPGDTISAIARAHRLSAEEIREVNGIDDQRSLRPGQNLYLPDPDPIGTKVSSLRKKAPLAQKASKTPARPTSSAEKILEFPVPNGTIFREFSRSKLNPYDGIGIKAKHGASVVAALGGRVLFVGDDGTKFGLLLILEHPSSLITVYTHLDQALVKTGQRVESGMRIGTVGVSGGVSSPRLHFQVRVGERPQDPKAFFKTS